MPYPGGFFRPTSFWADLLDNTYINIYAGSLVADPDQGTLMIKEIDAFTSEQLKGSGEFYTPTKVGALTLTAVDGDTVYFTYPGGKGTFDLLTDTYSL